MLGDLAPAGLTTGEGRVEFPLIPTAVTYHHKYSDNNLCPRGGEARIGVMKEYQALGYWQKLDLTCATR